MPPTRALGSTSVTAAPVRHAATAAITPAGVLPYTTTSAMAISYMPYLVGSFGAPPYTGYGNAYISHNWTVPLQTVLNIPAAGSYIVDLDVTGISGACTLVVLQP